MSWDKAQKWESDWWNSCVNTYGEEEKQLLYAEKMGLTFYHNRKSPYNINMDGKSVIDIGGGPVSLLLKCTGLARGTVIDPLKVPYWVDLRYQEAGIDFRNIPAEEFGVKTTYDEAWIYNCLQHTKDPEKIAKNALKSAEIVRVFEWIKTGTNEGHPHSFTAEILNDYFGGEGKVEVLKGQAGCFGACWYGIFVGAGLDS